MKRLFAIGLIGSGVAALCCFTPALTVLSGALGLTISLAWADVVLQPALVLFAGLTLFAAMRLRTPSGDAAACCTVPEAGASTPGEERAGS